ncbi:UNVERIFIED_CONTAM: hypothetical protein FKN15_065292 [Acipenser sinensis]
MLTKSVLSLVAAGTTPTRKPTDSTEHSITANAAIPPSNSATAFLLHSLGIAMLAFRASVSTGREGLPSGFVKRASCIICEKRSTYLIHQGLVTLKQESNSSVFIFKEAADHFPVNQ